MKILENKVALVTGGTSGIGKAVAIAFGAAGAKVVFLGKREFEDEDTVNLIHRKRDNLNCQVEFSKVLRFS